MGRADRTRRGQPPGKRVAVPDTGAAVDQRHPQPTATGDDAGTDAPLPAGRVPVAGVSMGPSARRHPCRRHGARQDAAVTGADLPRQASQPRHVTVPHHRADERGAKLGGRIRSVHARLESGVDFGHGVSPRRNPRRDHRGRRCGGHVVHPAADRLRLLRQDALVRTDPG